MARNPDETVRWTYLNGGIFSEDGQLLAAVAEGAPEGTGRLIAEAPEVREMLESLTSAAGGVVRQLAAGEPLRAARYLERQQRLAALLLRRKEGVAA